MQYLRKYRALIGNQDVSQFRIVFDIEKAIKEDPQYAQISIYNLTPNFSDFIQTNQTRIILQAGYGFQENAPFGLIYSGEILQIMQGRENGVDTKITFICQDGDTFLNSSFVAKTLSAGAKADDVVRTCTSQSSKKIKEGQISKDLSTQKLARSKTMFGKSRDILRDVTRGNKAQFYVDGDQLHIIKAYDVDAKEAFELNPKTGLIGTPTQNEDGLSGECLLNPKIQLNSLIYVNEKLIERTAISKDSKIDDLSSNGLYRILKINYSGDTHGDQWSINFEAIAQSGSIPNLLKNGADNPWR